MPAVEDADFGICGDSRGTDLAPEVGLERGLAFQHCAGDGEQSVRDAAQRAGMTVAAGSQRCVLGFADGVMLYGDAGPVVEGILQPVVGGQAAYHDEGLAGALGDGSDAGQASQGLIVSSSQSVMRFCEQRGEDDPADAGKRAQDFQVTLPLHPRRFVRGRRRSGQCCRQAVDLTIGSGQLLAGDGDLREHHLEMSDGGLGCAGGDGDGRLAQCDKQGLGVDPSNPVALEEVGDRPGADAPRLVGSGREAPEVANPGLGEIAFDLQELRIVAPELLAGPVHEPGSVTGQVVCNPRPLAQLDDLRCGRVQEPERVAVGSQGIAERTSIAAIVLGAGRREAVPEPVQLLRVERVDREAPLHQRLHHGPMRDLDSNPDSVRLCACRGEEPVRHAHANDAVVLAEGMGNASGEAARQEAGDSCARPPPRRDHAPNVDGWQRVPLEPRRR